MSDTPKFKTWTEDRDAVAKALLRSFDFLELGFSAKRPLGSNSLVEKDIIEAMGRDGDQQEDYEYARQVWSEMREHMPEFIQRSITALEMRERERMDVAKKTGKD